MGKKKHRRDLAVSPSPGVETFDATPSYSIGDPAFADFLRMSGIALTGELGEQGALGLTAFYRAVALISGTIAGLPLKVFRDLGGGAREQVDHFLSGNPAGPYDLSAFSWVEMVMLHRLLHAETYLKTITNGAGEIVGLWPIHPLAVTKVEWDGADKVFTVAMTGGAQDKLVTGEVTQILAMTLDGLRGTSPLAIFRNALTTAKAGETAAKNTFSTGALVSGLVTTEEDVDEDEAVAISTKLNAKMVGADNAGSIAFVNRSLKFSPWKMNNVDAQFIESRAFSVMEVARMFGLPLNLLSVQGAISNWGTGVGEANLGLQKYVLMGHTSALESGLKAILPPDHFAEFDYRGLLQGSPQQEIELLIAQVAAGLLTKDEARAIMNRPPLPEEPAPEVTDERSQP